MLSALTHILEERTFPNQDEMRLASLLSNGLSLVPFAVHHVSNDLSELSEVRVLAVEKYSKFGIDEGKCIVLDKAICIDVRNIVLSEFALALSQQISELGPTG